MMSTKELAQLISDRTNLVGPSTTLAIIEDIGPAIAWHLAQQAQQGNMEERAEVHNLVSIGIAMDGDHKWRPTSRRSPRLKRLLDLERRKVQAL